MGRSDQAREPAGRSTGGRFASEGKGTARTSQRRGDHAYYIVGRRANGKAYVSGPYGSAAMAQQAKTRQMENNRNEPEATRKVSFQIVGASSPTDAKRQAGG